MPLARQGKEEKSFRGTVQSDIGKQLDFSLTFGCYQQEINTLILFNYTDFLVYSMPYM